jgi:hypothetical protein
MIAAPAQSRRAFEFERDTFAWPHELVWKYHFDESGAMHVSKSVPPPTYYHRCFVMVRATRQFFYHARFEPDLPPVDASAYQDLIRKVVSCSVRHPCGAAWESYFLRSHWRMIFPTPLWYRKWMLNKLKDSLPKRGLTLVHLFRFPRITINHGISLYRFTESEQEIDFEGYDPNIPEHPVHLIFDKQSQQFTFAANRYWGGGELKVFEIYADWPY